MSTFAGNIHNGVELVSPVNINYVVPGVDVTIRCNIDGVPRWVRAVLTALSKRAALKSSNYTSSNNTDTSVLFLCF